MTLNLQNRRHCPRSSFVAHFAWIGHAFSRKVRSGCGLCPRRATWGLARRVAVQRGASWRGVFAVMVTVALAPACNADDGDASPPSTSSTTAAQTTSSPLVANADEQAVLDAYQGYWRAVVAANDPPDERNPLLRQFATGEAFESVFKAAQANRLEGRVLRAPPNSRTEHRAVVVSMTSSEATVRDCAIDDIQVIRLATGEVVNDKVATQLRTANLRREDGAWKVSFTKLEQRWEGIAGCAVEG